MNLISQYAHNFESSAERLGENRKLRYTYTQVHMYFDSMFLGNSCKDFSCSFLYSFIHELCIQLKAKRNEIRNKNITYRKSTQSTVQVLSATIIYMLYK